MVDDYPQGGPLAVQGHQHHAALEDGAVQSRIRDQQQAVVFRRPRRARRGKEGQSQYWSATRLSAGQSDPRGLL